MVEIKEFQPLIYNLEKIKKLKIDFKDIICPPYDVISPQQHRSLLRKKYNFVHLEFPKETKNKYLTAKKTFSVWKRSKILVKDEHPSVYVYQHKFKHPYIPDKYYTRVGIFCLIKADPEYETILPHEHTKPKPLEDRAKLLSTLNLQTSSPFFVVEDKIGKLKNILDDIAKPKYLILNFTDDQQHEHKLYRIVKSVKEVTEIKKFLEKQNLYIADGHHRYKVTTEYLKSIGKSYLMGYICSSYDEGLIILPTHRALPTAHTLQEIAKYFDFVGWDGKSRVEILVYHRGEFKVAKLKKEFQRKFKNIAYNSYFLLDKVLCEVEGEKIRYEMFYHQEMKEVVNFAEKYNGVAFILPPVIKEEFFEIVNKKLVFPPKSTYFYPKVPAGLLCYDIEF